MVTLRDGICFLCLCLFTINLFAYNKAVDNTLKSNYRQLQQIEKIINTKTDLPLSTLNHLQSKIMLFESQNTTLTTLIKRKITQTKLKLALKEIDTTNNIATLNALLKKAKQALAYNTYLEKYSASLLEEVKEKEYLSQYGYLFQKQAALYQINIINTVMIGIDLFKFKNIQLAIAETVTLKSVSLGYGLIAIILALIFSAICYRQIKLFLWKPYQSAFTQKRPSFKTKLHYHSLSLLTSGVLPIIILCIWAWGLHEFNLLANIGLYAYPFCLVILVISLLAMAKSAISINNPVYRLVHLKDQQARTVSNRLYGLAIITTVIIMTDYFIGLNPLPEALSYLIKLILYLALSITILSIIKTKFIEKSISHKTFAHKHSPMLWSIKFLRIIATISGLSVPILMILGYVWLSSLILYALIQTYLYLGFISVLYYFITKIIFKHYSRTRKGKKIKTKTIAGVKTDVTLYWAKTILLIVLVTLSVSILCIIWKVISVYELLTLANQLFFGISIGEWNISLMRIFIAIAVFVGLYKLTTVLENYLNTYILPVLTLPRGLYNTVSTTISYLGIIFALYIALLIMGISLSGLAYVMGGLSIGIGLGLQPIIINFISGIILLLERHIRRGDLLTVDGQEGIVKKISFRSTELVTRSQNTLIVPNSKFIADLVQNWSYKPRRIVVCIGVAYGTNADKVKKILLECAKACSFSLEKPEPFVRFMNYGDFSLNFELCIFIDNPDKIRGATSAINFIIDKKFKEANIEIPFPKQDIRIIEEPKKRK